ncbi:MAG: SRPBCC family protein [Acidimicrobiia bacterium]
MIEIVRNTDVVASPVDVWAVLSDFGGISAWADVVDHSCLMSGQTEGVGAVRRIQSGRVTIVERVHLWEPPSALGYGIEGLPPLVKSASNTWRVDSTDPGSTVSLATDVDCGPRPPQRVIAQAAARRLAGTCERLLADLDRLLQQRGAATTGTTT